MGRSRGPGGRLGLLTLLHEHREAVEYECIRLGLRLRWLGTERLTWRDLGVLVKFVPPDSPLARAIEPARSAWGLQEQLLAGIFDVLRFANWSGKGDKPKPLPRPGVEDQTTKKLGSGSMTFEQAREWRDSRRGR